MKRWIIVSIVFSLMLLAGCSKSGERDSGRFLVYTSIKPVAHVAAVVAGSAYDVKVLVGEGSDPHGFEPSPGQIQELSSASVYFIIGLPFEERIKGKLLHAVPDLDIVNADKGIIKRYMGNGHNHNEHERGHGMDPHVWLSPDNLKIIAKNIAYALKKHDPSNSKIYEKNRALFAASMDSLKSELAKRLRPFKGDSVLVFHPAFGYFLDSFGLTQNAIETHGREPSARELERIIAHARENNIKTVFVQPQFSRKSAERIAEAINCSVEYLDPLAYDIVRNMRRMADAIIHSKTAGN